MNGGTMKRIRVLFIMLITVAKLWGIGTDVFMFERGKQRVMVIGMYHAYLIHTFGEFIRNEEIQKSHFHNFFKMLDKVSSPLILTEASPLTQAELLDISSFGSLPSIEEQLAAILAVQRTTFFGIPIASWDKRDKVDILSNNLITYLIDKPLLQAQVDLECSTPNFTCAQDFDRQFAQDYFSTDLQDNASAQIRVIIQDSILGRDMSKYADAFSMSIQPLPSVSIRQLLEHIAHYKQKMQHINHYAPAYYEKTVESYISVERFIKHLIARYPDFGTLNQLVLAEYNAHASLANFIHNTGAYLTALASIDGDIDLALSLPFQLEHHNTIILFMGDMHMSSTAELLAQLGFSFTGHLNLTDAMEQKRISCIYVMGFIA